jgi:hypothetical protein
LKEFGALNLLEMGFPCQLVILKSGGDGMRLKVEVLSKAKNISQTILGEEC